MQKSKANEQERDTGHDLLTVEQAAHCLQMSASSIRSYIRQGSLKAFRVAGKRKVLIPRAEVFALLRPVEATGVSGVPAINRTL